MEKFFVLSACSGGSVVSTPKRFPPIPREIVRTAKSIFGRRNFYIQVGEAIEGVFEAQPMNHGSSQGNLDVTLGLITLFQAVESLTDSQAIDAVRTRLDWKYALHLPVHPPAIYEDALCQFRCRLFHNPALLDEFHGLAAKLLALKPSWTGNLQGVKSGEVLSTVCSINHAASVHEAICRTLEILAVRFPDLLKQIVPPQWYGRYSNLRSISRAGEEEALIEESIADIDYLLQQACLSGNPKLQELAEIKVLDQVRSQHFHMQSTELNQDSVSASGCNCSACARKVALTRRIHT